MRTQSQPSSGFVLRDNEFPALVDAHATIFRDTDARNEPTKVHVEVQNQESFLHGIVVKVGATVGLVSGSSSRAGGLTEVSSISANPPQKINEDTATEQALDSPTDEDSDAGNTIRKSINPETHIGLSMDDLITTTPHRSSSARHRSSSLTNSFTDDVLGWSPIEVKRPSSVPARNGNESSDEDEPTANGSENTTMNCTDQAIVEVGSSPTGRASKSRQEIVNQESASVELGDLSPSRLTIYDHPNVNRFLGLDWAFHCAYCRLRVHDLADAPAVVCNGCGPCSSVRYCSAACLLHHAWYHRVECASLSLPFPIDMTTLPRHLIGLLPNIVPIDKEASPERYLQHAFSRHCHWYPVPAFAHRWAMVSTAS